MAPIGTLFGLKYQRQTKVILAAAAVAGLELDTPTVEFKVTNKSPEYLRKFPLGMVPAFEDNKGFKLFEGAAIARHISSLEPESRLLGKDTNEGALVDQWVHFGESEISMSSYVIKALLSGYLGPYNKQMYDACLTRQVRALKFLDEHLAGSASGYLISDTMTLADLAIAAVSEQAAAITCGTAERAQYPHVFAHFKKVASHPELKEIFGEAEFVEKAMTYKDETA